MGGSCGGRADPMCGGRRASVSRELFTGSLRSACTRELGLAHHWGGRCVCVCVGRGGELALAVDVGPRFELRTEKRGSVSKRATTKRSGRRPCPRRLSPARAGSRPSLGLSTPRRLPSSRPRTPWVRRVGVGGVRGYGRDHPPPTFRGRVKGNLSYKRRGKVL